MRCILTICLLLLAKNSSAQTDTSASHTGIVMRTVGHEILLSAGDDSSTVLPVELVDGRYKIRFENEFTLEPTAMATAVQKVMIETNYTQKYRVEVVLCDSNLVVHGFEIGITDSASQIACAKRLQPKDCYVIYITILDQAYHWAITNTESDVATAASFTASSSKSVWTMVTIVLGLGLLLLFASRQLPKKDQSHIINLGKYQFNQRKMLLILKSSQTELTSKESDLLFLLYQFANETIERDEILQKVWGDEGDYVGRTLDVFISKLRKKLIADESVKIVNVRGVGYKLILD